MRFQGRELRESRHAGPGSATVRPASRHSRWRNRSVTNRPYGAQMTDVVLVRWPEETERLERLRAAGAPRLLLVGRGSRAPPNRSTRSRTGSACRPPRTTCGSGCRPWRRAQAAPRWRRPSTTTACSASAAAGSPCRRWSARSRPRSSTASTRSSGATPSCAGRGRAGVPTRNALDVHMLRLRRRIATLGLEVRTVRARGLPPPSARAQRPDRRWTSPTSCSTS